MKRESDMIKIKLKQAVRDNEEVCFSFWVDDFLGYVGNVEILIFKKGDGTQKTQRMTYMGSQDGKSCFQTKMKFTSTGIHYYYFQIVVNGELKIMKYDYNNHEVTLYGGELFKIVVYRKDFFVPDWAKEKVMYHIFVDRFNKSLMFTPQAQTHRYQQDWGEMPIWKPDWNGDIENKEFFMGNLFGIKEKLNYLQELGVEILYLSPVCRSQSSHRYDTADYENVDSYLGDNSHLEDLCLEAHKAGMKVILDAVFNHTGNDSVYFNQYSRFKSIGAYHGTESQYYNWYKRDGYGNVQYWWGFPNLPECNGENSEWQNYIYGEGGVIDKWFSLGIDGLRLDVADELTDDFIENIRKAVRRNNPDGYIIGEVWDNGIEKEGYGRQRQYLLGNGLDSVMNYPFTNAILKYVRFGDFECFTGTVESILLEYPKDTIYSAMNSLSTHDITRAITTLAGEGINNRAFQWVWDVDFGRDWQYAHDKLSSLDYELGKNRFKLATVIQYFLPGNPCIYYGDEAGLYGYKDPFNRKCYPWGNEDTDLLKFFKELKQTRKVLKMNPKMEFKICSADSEMLIFERKNDDVGVLIVINRSHMAKHTTLPPRYNNADVIFSINGGRELINPYGAVVIYDKSYSNENK